MKNRDEYQRTPLHYVCIDIKTDERASAADRLINAGEDVDAQDQDGWSPLHFAAQEGDLAVTEILIKAGANVSLEDSNGNTPLWVATMNSHHGSSVVAILLEHGANPNKKNDHGISAMEISPELFKRTT